MAADTPRISVITTVHNGERFLAQAIESILAQTFPHFEYMLVDDASTDRSPAILARYAAVDRRIVLLSNSTNINHSNAINTALAVGRGEFVAILDADDLAHPQRLEKQLQFLDTHPQVGCVGVQVQQIDDAGNLCHLMPFPTTCALSRWTILFQTPVLHSAAMMRRDLLQQIGGYSVRWQYANDYSLWAELIGRTGITNLPETLVSYRRHIGQTSSLRAVTQQGEVWLLIFRMLAERLSLRVPLNNIGVLYQGSRGDQLQDAADLDCAASLLLMIHERYLAIEQPDEETTVQINASCAQKLLTLAWVHRHSHRAESRLILRYAAQVDPPFWQRPQTRALLRRLCNRHTRQVING